MLFYCLTQFYFQHNNPLVADIRGKDNRHTPRNKNSRNQKESETGEIKQNKSKPARRSRKHDDDRDNQNPWSKARKEF
ncbi:hypothetical protein [Proteus mirabilis]|uniref:hypothetical protein n=1 Tax=Proteus mirabilis TaxID=584 RepID=UPI001E63F3B8|nr:hypothetical protein [Proteus mirabilis]MCD4615784.1 hypothetical protein [Proteus mirabilis]